MIDIHAHILPGVDDGAVDLAESLEMARQAVSGGTTELICTSHSAEWFEIGPLGVMQQQVRRFTDTHLRGGDRLVRYSAVYGAYAGSIPVRRATSVVPVV